MKILMATFAVLVQATIGSLALDRLNYVKISTTWKELADTATIKLPLLRGKVDPDNVRQSLAEKISNGDRVQIDMTYIGIHGTYTNTEFKGFVKRVTPSIPLEIECEDALYLFRRTKLAKEWKTTDNPTLSKVIQYIVSEVNANNTYKVTLNSDMPQLSFTKFRLGNNESPVNGAEALQFFKDNYGLAIYFDDLALHVRTAYTQVNTTDTVVFNLAGNVINNGLTFRKAEDVNIQLEATAILPDNSSIPKKPLLVPSNATGAEIRPFISYTAKDEASLKQAAEAFLKTLSYTGFEGSLTTFLVPFAKHSQKAELKDPDYEERNGNYLVDAVETEFSVTTGIRRKVFIGIKLS